MQDLVVLIPGIMGSVLRRGDDDVWNPGFGMAGKLLRHRRWAESLVMTGNDDPANTGWVDDIVPVGLAQSHTIIPGMFSIDGYSEIHKTLLSTFPDLIEGDPLEPTRRLDGKDPERDGAANYFQFAYDWRRDLRSSALRLHDLVTTALAALRSQRSPNAKVVLIGHSMGGLVARYYLYGTNPRTGEPFDGWRETSEVFTMGTPYRGSIDSFVHLSSGFRKLFVDFSEALQSFTGVYQLLPRYRMVLDQRTGASDDWKYPHEIEGFDGLSPARAKEVYDNLHVSVDQRIADLDGVNPGRTVPNIGFGHTTKNSVIITDDGLETSVHVPDYLDARYSGGDGTVPIISAIPPELDQQRSTLRYTNQRHGSLQVDDRLLTAEIRQRLSQAQAGTMDALNPVRSAFDDPSAMPAIDIDGPNYFLDGEVARVRLNATGVGTDAELTVRATPLGLKTENVTEVRCSPGAEIDLPSTPGEYRLQVSCSEPRLESQALYVVLSDQDAS